MGGLGLPWRAGIKTGSLMKTQGRGRAFEDRGLGSQLSVSSCRESQRPLSCGTPAALCKGTVTTSTCSSRSQGTPSLELASRPCSERREVVLRTRWETPERPADTAAPPHQSFLWQGSRQIHDRPHAWACSQPGVTSRAGPTVMPDFTRLPTSTQCFDIPQREHRVPPAPSQDLACCTGIWQSAKGTQA